ncbi:PAS-domain containing protein [Primorskyibacter aestuariivivens]|uniref:hybrid sensor histidine kinase/response regulator n=1 Tax=Primorskyibacter aestuariivivens TaxID=1888912 RepID=UPI0022FFFF53|nr:PAS-domain containing protein [Primorskyibacter aestuariivivens]MDA7430330.1 PAS-domain containing protein [Primorskyibacter aestuariivivens]
MTLINNNDSLERQNEKLMRIAQSLMRRVERQKDPSGLAYAQFERAALLEDQVRSRTRDLEQALNLLQESNLRLEQANAETEAARAYLTEAIESVNEGFALFDNTDTLVLCNSRFCQDMRDIAGKLVPGIAFDRYVELVSQSAYLALPDGETSAGWAAMRKSRHRNRNAMFNVRLKQDMWLQVSERRTESQGTVVLQTDVTDLIRLEREERARLQDKQARLIAATLEHLHQGVCIFDEEAQLLGWNARVAELLKIPMNRIQLGARFATLVGHLPQDFTLSQGMSRKRLLDWATRRINRGALRFEVAQANALVLDAFAQGLPDGGFVISFTDVTAERNAARVLQEMNERLEARVAERTTELAAALSAAERANASKSRFVAAASHDLLQPLSAAKLFLGSLEGTQSNVANEVTLDKVMSALGSVENIIEALLDISKLESGQAAFEVRPVALQTLFDGLRHQLEPLAAQKGLGLRIVDTRATVMSDASYLRRILQNLLGNAVRYTQTGKILMGARRDGDALRIEVRDTGPGIPEEFQDEVFREFARLDAPASASEGLGLGLAIVERACAGLGHQISLTSQPGRGTCFAVTVPMVGTVLGTVFKPPQRAVRSPATVKGRVVFLVENDENLRRALSMTLENSGADVIEAPNAETALELLEELEITPDALLFDEQLGGRMTGTVLFREITERYGRLPVRIISALRCEVLQETCRRMDVTLLNKPINMADLDLFLEEVANS